MVTPTEEVRKLQGEIDMLIKEAHGTGTYTSELFDELSSRARRISKIVKANTKIEEVSE